MTHTCGCSKRMPCERAARLFALGLDSLLIKHLQKTLTVKVF
jgi:hypothetical protein